MAKLDIHNVYAHSFILSTNTFLRAVCSPRYCVKKLKLLIPLFFGTPCIVDSHLVNYLGSSVLPIACVDDYLDFDFVFMKHKL